MASFVPIIMMVLLFGTSAFLRKMAVDGMSPYHLQILSTAIYVTLLPLWIYLAPKISQIPSMSTLSYGIAAIITNVIGAVTFGFTLKGTSSPAMLSSAISTSPLITAILAYLFLGETLTPRKILAIFVVLIGMIIFNT